MWKRRASQPAPPPPSCHSERSCQRSVSWCLPRSNGTCGPRPKFPRTSPPCGSNGHYCRSKGILTLETQSLQAKIALKAIGVFQAARSGRPSPCRFHPSCSTYAAQAISVHGAAKGSWLGIRRIVRCQPLATHGYDPVPAPTLRSSNHS